MPMLCPLAEPPSVQSVKATLKTTRVVLPLLLVLTMSHSAAAQTNHVAPANQPAATGNAAPQAAGTVPSSAAAPATAPATAPSTAPTAAAAPTPAAAPPTPAAAPPTATAAPATPTAPATPPETKPAICKEEWSRRGFYLRMITGGGYGDFRGTGPAGTPSVSGISGVNVISIGGSLTKGLVLAANMATLQLGGKFKGGPYQKETFASSEERVTQKATAVASQIGALVDWYPSQNYGFHAGLAVGLNQTVLNVQADDSVLAGAGGSAMLLLGYDWPISRTFAVGLALIGTTASSSTLKYSGEENSSGYELSSKSIALGASLLYF